MRLFYDDYTSRLRSELVLLTVDSILAVSIVFYASSALSSTASTSDLALLAFWSLTPRAVAKILSNIDRPGSSGKTILWIVTLVLTVAFLMTTGWELIHSTSPMGSPPPPLLLLLIFFCWGSGFLLFHPRAYRLQDFTVGATLLMCLRFGAPFAYLWIPIVLGALVLSAAVRHQVHDIFADHRRAPINLQNARAVTIVGGGGAVLLFLGLSWLLGGGRLVAPPKPPQRSSSAAGSAHIPYFDGDEERSSRAFSPLSVPRSGQSDQRTENDDRVEVTDPNADASQTPRFDSVPLRALARPQLLPDEVLRVRLVENKANAPGIAELWPPSPGVLWRAMSLSTYDTASQSWRRESSTASEQPWSRGLAWDAPPIDNARRVSLAYRIVKPVFSSFLATYFTIGVSTEAFTAYTRILPGGEVTPSPPFRPGTEYVGHTELGWAQTIPAGISRGMTGKIRDLYLQLPSAEEAGLDLLELTHTHGIADLNSVRESVAAIRAYYERENFLYSNYEFWGRSKAEASRHPDSEHEEPPLNPLVHFVRDSHRGDCTYFATATTLLLRAAGIPARFTVGFLGGQWDPKAHEVVVRHHSAHAWTEVFLNHGWYPIDATDWVPATEQSVFPETQPGMESLRATPATEDKLARAEQVNESRPHERTAIDDRSINRTNRTNDEWALAEEVEAREKRLAEGEPVDEFRRRLDSFVTVVQGEEPGRTRNTAEEALSLSAVTRETREEFAHADLRESRRAIRWELPSHLRTIARSLFVCLAMAICGALVLAHLRPRADKSEKEEGDEDDPLGDGMSAGESKIATPLFDDSARSRVMAAYYNLQLALVKTRSHRQEHQTPVEHGRGLRGIRASSEVEDAFLSLHRTFYAALYGERGVSADDVRTVERSCRVIRRALG